MPCNWAMARPSGQSPLGQSAALRPFAGSRRRGCPGCHSARQVGDAVAGRRGRSRIAGLRPVAWTGCARCRGRRRGVRRPVRRPRRAGARRGQRILDRMAHRLVHLAAVAKAHLDLGRVHVDVDPRRVDLDVQRVDRLALAVQHVLVGAARRVGEHLVAHEAAVDIGELLVGARRAASGMPARPADADRARAVDRPPRCARRIRRPARRPGAARASPARHCSTSLPSCQIAKPDVGPRRAHGGAPPRCSAPARWRRSSGTCGAPAC